MEDRKKVFNLIGLVTRAGRVASGEFSAEEAVKDGTVCLVITSEETSDNTRKMFTNMCTYYQAPTYFFGRKDELGYAMEKECRASLAVLDSGLGKVIAEQMNINGDSKYES